LCEISLESDAVTWVLETGKELERACMFDIALKYYFAGRMFFARLKHHRSRSSTWRTKSQSMLARSWKDRDYAKTFKNLYEGLLPMTNAEVSCAGSSLFLNAAHVAPVHNPFHIFIRFLPQAYADARDSVHYQNIVLKRGTMNK
jgi:hypothetical protein